MKLLIIKSSTESKWGSCKVISPNLHKLYQGLGVGFELDWFELPEDLLKGEMKSNSSLVADLFRHIEATGPDRLIFVDHLPPPPVVLSFLSMQTKLTKVPPIIFHLYGDFTYFSKQWSYLNEVLEGHPVRFVVASDSQKRLVNEFLTDDFKAKSPIEKLCFPVNAKDYFFNIKERAEMRAELGLTDDDIVILYSGRISLQKNVDLLINEFLKIKKEGKRYHLWVVGSFDDVGADFIGYESYPGYMFAKIQSILDGCSADELKRIKFFGHLGKGALRVTKSAADIFASFSLYHDEDYGMSPAEALATGLTSILTDWGGYSSFASSRKWHCDLLSVDLSEFGFELGVNSFVELAENYVGKSDAVRFNHSKEFLAQFSIEPNIEVLREILKKEGVPFSGFSWLLEQHAFAMNENWSKIKYNKFLAPMDKGYYPQLYNNYISGKTQEKNHDK